MRYIAPLVFPFDKFLICVFHCTVIIFQLFFLDIRKNYNLAQVIKLLYFNII